MAPPSILVIGAGELGIEVIKSLSGHHTSSQTRMAQAEIENIRKLGFSIVHGDIVNDTHNELAAAFSCLHTIICCSGMAFPPGTQTKVVHAALASVCRRYFPWQFGVDYDIIGRASSQDLFTEQLDVRDILRGQGDMGWVIVSTGMFISFLFEPAFGIVNEARDTVTAIGSWDNALTVTAPPDVGRVTAALALDYPAVKGVVHVTGDTVSMSQLADVVEDVSGKPVRRRLKTVEDLKMELAQEPGDGMRKYRVVFAKGTGVAWEKTQAFNVKEGIEMQAVRKWAQKWMLSS